MVLEQSVETTEEEDIAGFDLYRDDPDFRRLVYPEEFEGEEKA